MNKLYEIQRPVVFAHRGSSLSAPENTLPAFEQAVRDGADVIELDVKLTADEKVVVIHDSTIDRTTNGSGKVADLSLTELRQFDAGGWFSESFIGDVIPTLESVFELIGRSTHINIELTNYSTPTDSLVACVANIVKRFDMIDSVFFSSFLPGNLMRANRLLPMVPVALLALPSYKGILSRGFIGRWIARDIVHPHLDDVDENFITSQHRMDRRVHVWTVNDPEDLMRLYHWGVDGVFTDHPMLALRLAGKTQV